MIIHLKKKTCGDGHIDNVLDSFGLQSNYQYFDEKHEGSDHTAVLVTLLDADPIFKLEDLIIGLAPVIPAVKPTPVVIPAVIPAIPAVIPVVALTQLPAQPVPATLSAVIKAPEPILPAPAPAIPEIIPAPLPAKPVPAKPVPVIPAIPEIIPEIIPVQEAKRYCYS